MKDLGYAVLPSEAIHIKEFCSVIYLISLTTILLSAVLVRDIIGEKVKYTLLGIKEALIGKHNLRSLLAAHKRSMIDRAFWVISYNMGKRDLFDIYTLARGPQA